MKYKFILMFVVGLFLLSSISASIYSDCSIYGSCSPISTTTSSVNYSLVNVNNSNYLEGHNSNYFATTSGYVPYTGANQNVNLGNNNLTVNGTALFVNTNNSRVGIGTTSPISKFHVLSGGGYRSGVIIQSDGSTGTYASLDYINKNGGTMQTGLYDTGNAFFYLVGTGSIGFYTNSSERLTVSAGGNVGIGTTNPFTALHVNGNILANGTINATSGFGVNGKSGITGNYTILKDADLVMLTKTYCYFNITGGLITGTNC